VDEVLKGLESLDVRSIETSRVAGKVRVVLNVRNGGKRDRLVGIADTFDKAVSLALQRV
jgi:hypothetical protein